MKYIIMFLTTLLALILTTVSAQFVTPLTSISGDALVITQSGNQLEGKIKNAVKGPDGLVSFKLKDQQGNTHKMKAADVKELKIKVDGLAKVEMISEQTANIKKLAHANFNEVVKRDYIVWQQVKLPNKKGKQILLQLLNPGFDHKLRVYDKPNAKSGELSVGAVAVSGGEARAYYVVKNGETYLISKKNTKKQGYQQLFSDCKALNKDKPIFKEFAIDVFTYDQSCQ